MRRIYISELEELAELIPWDDPQYIPPEGESDDEWNTEEGPSIQPVLRLETHQERAFRNG